MNTITICQQNYSLETKVDNLLQVLKHIKQTMNNSLAFRSGCKSGVCGSCAVRVNGVEKLACKTTINNNDTIEPLNNSSIIKDLVVSLDTQERFLQESKASLEEKSSQIITKKDQKDIDLQSNCILCNSCFSSCPVYDVNSNFKGPFALTRTYRYIHDKKELHTKDKIDAVQENGVWDCTLCGNCNMVCPEHIDIKNDIMMLRNISVQAGYSDPNMLNFDMGFDSGIDFLNPSY